MCRRKVLDQHSDVCGEHASGIVDGFLDPIGQERRAAISEKARCTAYSYHTILNCEQDYEKGSMI